jgi:hypothetical protein
MCDEAPHGADPKTYKIFVDAVREEATVDFSPNICRAKYKGDQTIRKT